ncbi:hypothetical protein C9I86_12905 [Photobacterium sp. NCIMB 13483]|uniref:AbiTii domain-containing protein n=1 Tax=Photobacterium sp. NCIMB 13483 TaxID=2022103 RepID=UPI000D15BC0F|nr:hypothetical protein [Photobacterium sp. NCIMB 13483]PST87626.1 hypothetical protein C9I86_12905 [Photobacterium sp. NCIMB 13483]
MSSIILELQADAMNDNVSIQSLLRKAYTIAIKLSVEDSRQWIEAEMNGYDAGSDVPVYRCIKGTLQAVNPYRGPIPAQVGNTEMEDTISVFHFRQSIAEIEGIISNHSKGFLIPFTGSPLISLQDLFQSDFPFRLNFSATSLVPIVDNVRNTILKWALRLEQEGVTGEGLSFSSDEVRKAHMSTHINIKNFQGVLGDVTDSELNQNLEMTISEPNNFDELAKYLVEHNVPENDIVELKQAIDSDGNIGSTGQFGSSVSSWVGNMCTKAVSGGWAISLATAANVLGTGISKYYGL